MTHRCHYHTVTRGGCADRYDYAALFDSVLDATEVWAEHMSYNTRFEQQRELEKTQMKVALHHMICEVFYSFINQFCDQLIFCFLAVYLKITAVGLPMNFFKQEALLTLRG